MRKILWWIILVGVIVKLASFIYINKSYFLRRYDPSFFGELYSKSQYVMGQASIGGIGDDGLYAFAGYYYLFQRGDVSAVNFEHPPLGKYLIGLSIAVFGNENIINIFYFILLLYLTYKLGMWILNSSILSLSAVLVLSFDPLFLDNLLRSLLDLPFTLFFIGGIYFFVRGMKKNKYFYISFIFWGAAFSTRFFPIFIILWGYMLLMVFIYQKKSIATFTTASTLVSIIYLFSHISFFIYHPSVMEFLRHKKWMLSWFTGSVVLYGNIWQNILTGTYFDSTKKITVNTHWTPVVPLVVIMAITSIPGKIVKLKRNLLIIVYGICLIYIFYLTFLTGGLQKFLMPIYPLLIILATRQMNILYSIINTWLKKTNISSRGR